MDIDLTPLINWNTHTIFASLICEFTSANQHSSVSVWDQRVMRTAKEHHHIQLANEHVEYYLTDINNELSEKEIKIYFRWEYMSTIGTYYAEMVELTAFTVPKKHFGNQKRNFTPGPTTRNINY